MSEVVGRRMPDTQYPDIPDGIQPGDYWKCLNLDIGDHYPTNLTRTVWGFYSPDGNGVGHLFSHTVRENDDGTITIAPGDGSSNSVLHQGGARGLVWHGYVNHGVWTPC